VSSLSRFHPEQVYVDEDAEISLLAAMARRPQLYWELADWLGEAAFPAHGELYRALEARITADNGRDSGSASTADRLLGGPVTAEPAGAAAAADSPEVALQPEAASQPLAGLDGVAPTEDPEATARHLADLLQRRILAARLARVMQSLREGEGAEAVLAAAEEAVNGAREAVRELAAGQMTSAADLLEVARTVAQAAARSRSEGRMLVLSTGLRGLDALVGGLQAGVHLLAAEPGQGKTTLALQMAINATRQGVPVVFVSFEESPLRLVQKAVAHLAGVNLTRVAGGDGGFTGTLDVAEGAELQESVIARVLHEHGQMLRRLYLVEGTSRITTAQVRGQLLRAMAWHEAPIALLVVDYLQRWAAARRDFSEFRHVVSALVSDLREMALRLGVPVLAIASQNRVGQGTAFLTSLKESGDLEYSADTCMFLVKADARPATPPARGVDLRVEKNRYGDVGLVRLIFRPDIATFREEAR